MQSSVSKMTQRIAAISGPCRPSVYLFGSVPLGDFRLGWSDIDILVLTRSSVSQAQAEQLLYLRQTMLEEDPGDPYYRSFEGGILSLEAFMTGRPDRVVYWGTTGERITTHYPFDPFSMSELLDTGILLYGDDVRQQLTYPSYGDMKEGVRRHYESIRAYARRTGRDLYSYGWLLDISRCIYTLRTGKIIPKTAAGAWALEENICPCPEALERAVEIRKEPLKYRSDPEVLDRAETLGDLVQEYADILELELKGDRVELWDLYNERRERTGRDHIRGEEIPLGSYHLVVHVWIRNSRGEYLISQRSADRPSFPLMWECVGGSVLKGEDSLTGALRETVEEVGVTLSPGDGRLIRSVVGRVVDGARFSDILDVWLFSYDGPVALEQATTKEVAQTRWMTKAEIRALYDAGKLVHTLDYYFTMVDKE